MKKYYIYTVKKLITVQEFISIEYFEVGTDFLYPKEAHDFYEFLFVEKGGLICETEKERLVLEEGDFLLIPPNTYHSSFSAECAENSVIMCVCFKSRSGVLSVINGKNRLEEEERELTSKILTEARATFVFPFNKKLALNANPRLGSQQLIEIYIEELLIKLIQRATYNNDKFQVAADSESSKKYLVGETLKILKKRLYSRVSLSDISESLFYSKTYLNSIFKEATGDTIMQYYQGMKIEEAKRLLGTKESVTSVSEKLCFENPQYFSKVFKQRVGTTPKEYREHNFKI